MTTATLLRLLADHLLALDPVDSGYLVNAARRRAEVLEKPALLRQQKINVNWNPLPAAEPKTIAWREWL